MQRIIEQTADGSATLFVPELNEHYHSVKGAHTESQHIFIDMGLNATAAVFPHVLEVGFGTGLNALLTLENAGKTQKKVHYTGIELYPLAWEEVDTLHYSDNPLFRELHAAPWETDVEITPWFTLRKTQIDVANPTAVLPAASYDVVYFDAFAPEKQPEMWDESVFRRLFAAMSPDGILTTYCAKGGSPPSVAIHRIHSRASARPSGRKKRDTSGQKNSRPVSTEKAPIFSQLGKNYCPVREKYFPNWEKIYPN